MTPDQFKTWRKSLGFNQAEAGAALGVSRGSIENYERGERREDGRPVEIPLAVKLACDMVILDEAAKRRDLSLLSLALQGRVRRLADLLPSTRLGG